MNEIIIRNENSNIETVEIQDHATGAWITPPLYKLLTELDDICWEHPESVEERAGEIEDLLTDPRTPFLVAQSFIQWSGRYLAFLQAVARNELDRRRHHAQRVYWSEAMEVEYRQEVRDQARRDAEAVMNARVPFVTDLRLGKRGRERYERIDCKVTRSLREQGGIPKICTSARQQYPRLGDVKRYREYLKAERSRTPDQRRDWRREQRKLTGE